MAFLRGKPRSSMCAGNFHGRTVTTISFSSDEQYRRGFGPFTPEFRVIPYGLICMKGFSRTC
jgi:ornithine--oxo-acid transaminase